MAQKRIDFFGQFRPTGIDQTAGAKYRALAGLGDTVSDMAFKFGAQEAQKQGKQAGLESVKRDEQGGIIAPEEKGNFTFFDKAYNEAALLAYRAEVGRDTRETVNKLKNEFADDPEAFNANAQGYLNGIMEGMPEGMAPIISDDIKNEISSASQSVQNNYFKKTKQQNVARVIESALDLEDDILNAARGGDNESLDRYNSQYNALISKGVEAGLIDNVKAVQQREALKESIITNKAIGAVSRIFDADTTIEEKVSQAQAIIKEQGTQQDLSPTQKDSIVNTLRSTVNEQIKLSSEKTAAEEKAISFQTVELQLDAQFSRRPPAEIQADALQMFTNNELSEKEYKGVLTDIMQQQEKAIDKNGIDTKVSKRIAGNESLIVSQKEVDEYYERNIAPVVDSLSAKERGPMLANLAIKAGYVPSQVTQRIKNGLRAESPELIAESADLINRLDSVRGIDAGVSANDRAFAAIVNDMTGIMDPQEAIKYATDLTDPRNKERVTLREQEIKDEDYADDYSSWVESEFNQFMGADVGAVALGNMTKEFKDIFELHYKAGMDKSQAKAKAEQLMNKNWSYSESSKSFMKYAPEQYYSVQGDSSYITKQLGQYVASNFVGGEPVKKSMLVSDTETGRLASAGQPDYLVVVEMENGMLDTLRSIDPKDGKLKAIRWSPDVDKEQKAITKRNLKIQEEMRSEAIDPKAVSDAIERLNNVRIN